MGNLTKTNSTDIAIWAAKAAANNQTIAQYIERAFDLQRKKGSK